MEKSKFMQEAIQEARKGIAKDEGGPFGAVIVKDGIVIGAGHNEVIKQKDPTCHGEVMAIRNACQNIGSHDLTGCVLYTTGEPCPMCQGAILWANIDKVYYGCNIEDTEKIGFRDKKFYDFGNSEQRNAFMEECDREACLGLYDEYMNLSQRTNY